MRMPVTTSLEMAKTKTAQALETVQTMAPQIPVDIMPGVSVRRTAGGIPVVRLHYSAHPDRNPDQHPEWKAQERRTYTSQADWDREQEILDEAGGGELVFADTLVAYWDKIVITDPAWRPDPQWTVIGGFDHGKTNPTALERAYIDYEGVIYFSGEYYVPGKSVWQHAPELLRMPDVNRFEACYADPTVFDQRTQQERGKEPKAIAQVYAEEGVEFLTRFHRNRNDQTFTEALLAHWGDLAHRNPTVRIVCRNYSDRPQPGRHDWDCPNLLWELMRTRRRKLTAIQLMSQNQSEEIIDKDNHARDAMKYVVMSLPEPTEKTWQDKIAEKLDAYRQAGMDEHSLNIYRFQMEREDRQREEQPAYIGRRRYGRIIIRR